MTHGTVFMSEAGPVPHIPATGKAVSVTRERFPVPTLTRSRPGSVCLVDVESGPDGALYALSQGDSPGNVPPATPALPNSGKTAACSTKRGRSPSWPTSSNCQPH